MKRIMTIILSAVLITALALTLTACGESNNTSTDNSSSAPAEVTEAAATGSDENIPASEVIFTYNGTAVELNSEADAVIAALGDYNDMSAQLSCHGGEGDDKTYIYNGFTVGTYPMDGVDRILEVVISEAGIPTSQGIQVGDPVSKVTETYGTNYKQVGMYYAYNTADGKCSLQFFVENDTVQEIDYYYNV